jgi:outer membrane protein assembly factor BamB
VRRYPLGGGGPQWSATLTGVTRALTLRDDARVLLVTGSDDTTTAVDADSGALLWRSDGGISAVTGDAVLLARHSPEPRTVLLRLLALRTGRLVWSRPIDDDMTWRVLGGPAPDAAPTRVVVIADDGLTTTLRFSTGTTVAQAELNLDLRQWEGNFREDYGDDFTEVTGVGDALYVTSGHNGTSTLTAYAADTLTPRWSITPVPPGGATDCGSALCITDLSVAGADPGAVTSPPEIAAIDPATGARLWSSRAWESVYPVSGDRLIATASAPDGPPRAVAMLDTATGRTVAELPADEPVHEGTGPHRGMLRTVHPDTARAGRAWIGGVDLRTGRSSVIGSIDRPARGCTAAGRLLACTGPGGPLTVWRLPGRPG